MLFVRLSFSLPHRPPVCKSAKRNGAGERVGARIENPYMVPYACGFNTRSGAFSNAHSSSQRETKESTQRRSDIVVTGSSVIIAKLRLPAVKLDFSDELSVGAS